VLRKKDSGYPRVFEDLGPRPVVVRSDAQLKRICEKEGFVSAHLENNTTKSRNRGPGKRTYVMKGGRLVLRK